MFSSERLKPVHRVAENREREAARSFGDAQRNLKEQENKLQQLIDFEKEYQERFENASRGGMSASQLQEYQGFMAKLQDTIRQQEAVVERSRQESGSKKQHWQQKHTRTQAIGKAIDRSRREEDLSKERREQKESDERAMRRHGPSQA